jgi:type VI secretion system protein ImpA
MDHAIIQRAQVAFSQACGIEFETLVAPFDGPNRAGVPPNETGVQAAIKQAREADDASLPLGAWEHELRRADWDKVAQLTADALAQQGKDLQLAAWLLEAQIYRYGFSAIGGCLHLIERLCVEFWDDLHPNQDAPAYTRRANIFSWMNRKLPPLVRQIPMAMGAQEHHYCLADWERARRYEQHRQADPGGGAEGPSASDLSAAMAATPSETYAAMERELSDAIALLERLSATLGERMGRDAPALGGLGAALEQARALFDAELYRRGARRTNAATPIQVGQAAVRSEPERLPALAEGPIRDRAEAYARLDEVAAYLQCLEPHSPVPYLIRRAAEWGQHNAVELYQELFLRLNGQINIFEMMGLEAPGGAHGN